MYYIMTGEHLRRHARPPRWAWSTRPCPLAELRARTTALAKELLGKNPTVLRAAKAAVRHVQVMSWEKSDEYLMAKSAPGALPRHRERPRTRG